ncbi:MAG: cyclodeaminase/cyclohydrolase family protein [Anaerolineae bacterium]|jgi:formiminotetrahydrofolate cyclodeaminase|nr:cyclodeaminase/cyclohydrolase family protein [Anaerolineae bacterium]
MPDDRLVDLSIREFSERLASSEPAPGGGSASAAAGAMAAGLAAMVARLTIGREKYAAHQDEMEKVLAQAERLRGQMLALVDADTVAYQNVMAAYRLPKGDAEQQAARKSAVQEALLHAADIPLAAAEAAVQILNLAALASQHGNKNAASDAAVSALLAHAALHGAARNVRINLEMIDNKEFGAAAELRLSGLIENGEAALRRVLGA